MPPNADIRELLDLTRENNRLLHKMHRRAIWGNIIKMILYAIIFVLAPLYLYTTYIAPMMQEMLRTYQQIQGTGAQAQAQFSDFENMLRSLQEKIAGFGTKEQKAE